MCSVVSLSLCRSSIPTVLAFSTFFWAWLSQGSWLQLCASPGPYVCTTVVVVTVTVVVIAPYILFVTVTVVPVDLSLSFCHLVASCVTVPLLPHFMTLSLLQHVGEVYTGAFVFSITGYLGISFVLQLVRLFGALLAVTGTAQVKDTTCQATVKIDVIRARI